MGIPRIRVSVSNGEGGTERWVQLPVDLGAKYMTLPRRVLASLDIQTTRRETFRFGNGQPLTRDLGFALVRYRHTSARTQVVFGELGDLCILGVVALGELGLEVNRASGRIRKSSPCLLPFRLAPGS